MTTVSARIVILVGFVLVPSLGAPVVDGEASGTSIVEAECSFSIHEKGPTGKELKGTSLDAELYYRIRCKPRDNYCLKVTNCTVTNQADNPKAVLHPIIDDLGCTEEPGLFENITYEDNFTAGIYNPVPIRFRGSQSAIKLQCVTVLLPIEDNGKCERPICPRIDTDGSE